MVRYGQESQFLFLPGPQMVHTKKNYFEKEYLESILPITQYKLRFIFLQVCSLVCHTHRYTTEQNAFAQPRNKVPGNKYYFKIKAMVTYVI